MIVPWPPGGGVDIAARTIGPKISDDVGQPVVVDNRAGAAGMIGTEFAARASADGYTILLAAAGPNAILPVLMPKAPYDALRDFSEIALFANLDPGRIRGVQEARPCEVDPDHQRHQPSA